jgi:4-alpha-glucanotransferase
MPKPSPPKNLSAGAIHWNLAVDGEVLHRAAERWGIQLSYADTWGEVHTASEQTILAVLRALGVRAGSSQDIQRDLELRDATRWSRPLGITTVARENADFIPLRIPEESSGASVKVEFQWEDGSLQHAWFFLPELPELERLTIAGRTYIAKRVPLPKSLPLGYHNLRVYWVKEPELTPFGEARLVVCPARVHTVDERLAGVALSLYGLRSARNWGCGDFTDLRAAIDAFAPAGAAFIALNPLHAIPNRQPYNVSPYLPECSLYRNFLYLDVERVPGFEPGDTPPAQALAALRATELVEYQRVAELKQRALRAAYARFGGSPDFEAYISAEGALLQDYAIYSALWRHIHEKTPGAWLWTDWPQQYRDPRSPAVAAFAEQYGDEVRFHKFLQWQIDVQLAETQAHAQARGMKIGLYHDLALATDRFGADLWINRSYYATGARVGAPPDELAPSGQDWGFPPPHRDAHRENGYQLFARSIRNNARHGGALRIDHVMRLFRLFWIPDGVPARDGAYVEDYVEDLLGVLALESARGKFLVIGEDLGTVEPRVRERLDEAGIFGYRLLWFEKQEDGSLRDPQDYSEHAAVSTSTHDLPTLAGFPLGRDIEARRAAGLIDEEAYKEQWEARRKDVALLEESLAAAGFPNDPLGFVLATQCQLAIVNQEDLTGETEQQNLPATTWEHPNWRRKMKVAVEEFGGLAEELRRRIEKSGRAAR